VFLKIWKPYAPVTDDCCSSMGAASSREMKRFRAPNILMMRGCGWVSVLCGDVLLLKDEDIWRFWDWGWVIARICGGASGVDEAQLHFINKTVIGTAICRGY
jgi:hypothetical protein